MKFIVALTIVSVVCGQGPEQQPQHQDQFQHQMGNQLTQQQFEQMMEQNPSFRAAPTQPLQPLPQQTEQRTQQQQQQQVSAQLIGQNGDEKIFLITNSQGKQEQIVLNLGAQQKPQQQQVIIAEAIQQPSKSEQIIFLQGQPQKQQQEKIILQVGNKQEQVILGQKNPQVIKVELEEHHKPQPPPSGKHCHMLGRKGECTSIPSFFSCIRDGAILAPAFSECSFIQACCIRNFFSQS